MFLENIFRFLCRTNRRL